MTLGLDSDVLVSWMMRGSPFHGRARELLERELAGGGALAVTPQVLYEFVHIVSDARRFETPMEIDNAVDVAQTMWNAPEVVQVTPGPAATARTFELLSAYRLGRKRILDTALAAALETAGVKRLATFNGRDFRVFPFIEIVES